MGAAVSEPPAIVMVPPFAIANVSPEFVRAPDKVTLVTFTVEDKVIAPLEMIKEDKVLVVPGVD